MGYRSYSIEQKIKFLDLLKETRSVTASARQAGVLRGTAKTWIPKEKKLRLEYEASLKPVDPEAIESGGVQQRRALLEEKIQCIQAIDAGLPVNQASQEFGYSLSTVQSWYRAKDGLLALYYLREGSSKQEDSIDLGSSSAEVLLEGALMSKDPKEVELAKAVKAQKKELEYLRHRVAYLESLNAILQERSGSVKKKTDLKQPSRQMLQEDET